MSTQTKPGYQAYLPASYQSLGPEQDQQLDLILASSNTANTDNTDIAKFWVRTPNVRCRTRVTILLEADNETDGPTDPFVYPITVLVVGAGRLWVAEKERTRGGGIFSTRGAPVSNVVATAAAPLAVPTDLRLWGYTFDVETCGQELYGEFNPPDTIAAPASSYKWHIIVRYESVQRLTDEEWNQFKSRYGVRVQPEAGLVID